LGRTEGGGRPACGKTPGRYLLTRFVLTHMTRALRSDGSQFDNSLTASAPKYSLKLISLWLPAIYYSARRLTSKWDRDISCV
jgi:hypothetical protein